MSSESLPTRTSDLRFSVLDECERLSRADWEIVLRPSLRFEITDRSGGCVRILATYRTVPYPLAVEAHPGLWDPKVVARIRDLEDRNGSVIAEI